MMKGRDMRLHFISRLALLVAAGFLAVASQVWRGGTLAWLFILAGVVMLTAAALDAEEKGRAQRAIDGLIAILGAWAIVEAIVLTGASLRWFSFAIAVALAVLSAIGLVIHESSTERIVHEPTVAPNARPRAPLAR
jgi:hypothetical protein